MAYIDALIHISDVPALIATLAVAAPDHVQDGAIVGFERTPVVMSGVAGLTYLRLPEAVADLFRATPGVTILAEAPYAGPGTADAVYAAVFADPVALALYDAVYPRTPETSVEDGVTVTYVPPERFGQMG